jgi:amino acid transporter/mannitol/fructose-specific phosphotransferase system IIA component (Ntr-type)
MYPFTQNIELNTLYINILGSLLIVIFMFINLMRERENKPLQIAGFGILFLILAYLVGRGLAGGYFHIEYFRNFFTGKHGAIDIFYASGLVVVPYIVGFSKMTLVGEEVKNPEKNIPLGMILSATVVTIIYIVGILAMIGDLGSKLSGNYHPVATLAELVLPGWAVTIVIMGIFFAFLFAFNSGSHSATRYPVAMSRDNLVPAIFKKLNKHKIPTASIIFTSLTMIIMLWAIPDVAQVAKLASTFQLLIFGLMNLSVIVMRMSRIHSYDPGFRSPLFPFIQIFGIISSIALIIILGLWAILLSLGLVILGLIWYFVYVRGKVERYGAVRKVFDKLYNREASVLGIEQEFREILKEKGLRHHDDFDSILERSIILDIEEDITPEEFFEQASEQLSMRFRSINKNDILGELLETNKTGMTPVAEGIAIPHAKFDSVASFELLIARVKHGLPLEGAKKPIKCIFVIIGSRNDPKKHLRILAEIAVRADKPDFLEKWEHAKDENDLWRIMKVDNGNE